MNVADPVADSLGEDAIDETNNRRIVGAAEQILGSRDAACQRVEIVIAINRPGESGRALVERISSLQISIECHGAGALDFNRPAKVTANLQQHRGIRILAQGNHQFALFARDDENAVGSGVTIRNVEHCGNRDGILLDNQRHVTCRCAGNDISLGQRLRLYAAGDGHRGWLGVGCAIGGGAYIRSPGCGAACGGTVPR